MNPLLLLKYWKFIAGALLLAGIWFAIHHYGSIRYDAGKDYVQTRWNAETDRLKAIAAAELAKNREQDAADAARNEQLEKAHAQELASALADRDRNYRLLQQARQRAASGSDSPAEVAGIPPIASAGSPGSSGPPDFAAQLDGAIADLISEARANASQLDALIAEIKPQL